ncbi:MAG: hypothetical protein FJ225_09380 [Lentisphaerae bacterium]|nr:hypothetical protein [Lentisphaerota bacterium]
MKTPHTPREHAVAFIAAYDTPEAGAYEKHVVRVARSWLRIMRSDRPAKGIVDRIMQEFAEPRPADYGCGWDTLRERFTEWAVTEEWIDPPRPGGHP